MTALRMLPNIGAMLAMRLGEVGIVTREELAKVGPAAAYRRLCVQAKRRLPVCYYLYSLEGALHGRRWSDLSPGDKARLRRAAELETA